MKKLFGAFEDLDLSEEFDVSEEKKEYIKNLDIVCAAYDQESYSGDAFILFREDGKLYEVNDSHCSCYGLQYFDPEETTKEALMLRGDSYGAFGQYSEELKNIIKDL
jgi:hypothetical protein